MAQSRIWASGRQASKSRIRGFKDSGGQGQRLEFCSHSVICRREGAFYAPHSAIARNGLRSMEVNVCAGCARGSAFATALSDNASRNHRQLLRFFTVAEALWPSLARQCNAPGCLKTTPLTSCCRRMSWRKSMCARKLYLAVAVPYSVQRLDADATSQAATGFVPAEMLLLSLHKQIFQNIACVCVAACDCRNVSPP